MSRRSPNQGRNQDVYLHPREQVSGIVPTSAGDLTAGQVWLLVELAARHGGHPADRCQTLYGFAPTDTDRAIIDRVMDDHAAEWSPWIEAARKHQHDLSRRKPK